MMKATRTSSKVKPERLDTRTWARLTGSGTAATDDGAFDADSKLVASPAVLLASVTLLQVESSDQLFSRRVVLPSR